MSDDEPTENPLVTEVVQRALAPYATLLAPEVISAFAMITSEALEVHPVGTSLVARLSPGLQAAVTMGEEPLSQQLHGFAFGEMMRATWRVVRNHARERDQRRFLMPDTPLLVMQALLGYLGQDEAIWTAPDALVRAALDTLCDAIVGALFMGLVIELRDDPSVLAEYGETGRAISQVVPRMAAALRDALSRMPRGDRQMLADYEDCDWDFKRLSDRLRGDMVNARCFQAFGALGEALSGGLSAAMPK